MASYRKILTMQDISCFGQCSITVALPILSALGFETCILPSAVLSTHTCGFKDFSCLDLTNEIPLILKHWQQEKLKFSAIYSGYLSNVKQIEYVKFIRQSSLADEGFKVIVDPAMADRGKLYPAFNYRHVEYMRSLILGADIILPNLTEACFLVDIDYRDFYDDNFVNDVLLKLRSLGAKTIILTDISFDDNYTGVVVLHNNIKFYYKHKRFIRNMHGTGDIFSSVFVGLFLREKSVFDSAKMAANFVLRCIENTIEDIDRHWWGVKFETELTWLIENM